MKQTATYRGHHVLTDCLTPRSVVLDLGAHHGEFSQLVTARYGCRAVAVEPVPALFASIPQSDHIERICAAVSPTPGTVQLSIANNPEENSIVFATTSAVETIPVQAITLEELVGRYGAPTIDLVKMDIEGAEIDVLAKTPPEVLLRIAQLSVEFHDFMGAAGPSRETVLESISKLRAMGFEEIVFSRSSHSDVLLLNTTLLRISPLDLRYLRSFVKYRDGLRRIASRLLGSDQPNRTSARASTAP